MVKKPAKPAKNLKAKAKGFVGGFQLKAAKGKKPLPFAKKKK